MKTVLTIDGGGIRGIIPALILAEIEKRTGERICELFDLIAGTSTGGILALGLVKPNENGEPAYTAAKLATLYEDKSERIFDKQFIRYSLKGLFDERYSNEGIEEVLEEYFGDYRLSDSLTYVMIIAYEIEKRTPWFFKCFGNEHPNFTKQSGDLFMKDVAQATSAAPTYFEPKRIKIGKELFAFVDGGIFANNPAMCAYADAKVLYPEEEELLVVSLGTGSQTEPIRYEKAKDWGVANWAPAIIGIAFDGLSETVDYQLRKLLPLQAGVERYYRFQSPLEHPDDALDNVSKDNINKLKEMAEEMIRSRDAEIDRLCDLLVSAKEEGSG
ncbi:CBASS cGAMP-activated phospholipase [Planococcus lenghuensis]|uniref:Patatin n=1 Tax=Planococcus lenghuensis TaxID=2213202 RepID=A0A1Q2L0W5_9BACL|nr:CBASS cGAMP-activated phospholipase [Planococcus lenghuensis]AQQ54105.1 patatin [Planococcus lenghuensis]